MIRVRDFLADQGILGTPGQPPSPLVSVVLPTYRRAKGGLLERAIRSVLGQSLADFELLVMDDGSTDGSFEIIEALRAGDSRIVHVRHDHNCGLPGLRVNEGIELARGTYVAFQFDDDCWRPRALEALVTEAARQDEPTVIIGRCQARGRTHEIMMPFRKVDLGNLMHTNFIANNSVLVPRCLFDEHGMYDCHIAMRRLCDWDLWQRLIKQVPFVTIEEIVSDVFAEQPDSVMMTMPYDLALVGYLQAIDRNGLLTPRRWREYEVDSLRIGGGLIGGEFRKRLYEDQVVPYYLRLRHCLPKIEGFAINLPSPSRSVLYARPSYDSLNELAFNCYDALANRRGTYKGSFQYSTQMQASWVRDVDTALLVRPHQEQERAVMEQGLASGRPMGVYLDDDFLTLHEYGPPFDFMAPGTPSRRNLVEMLERADTVWVTSPFIAESVQSFNRRIVPHGLAVAGGDLPVESPRRRAGEPLRIGHVGTSYRLEEFRVLWDALLRLSAEFGARLAFEFWGLDVSSLPPLASPVQQVPYETSYFRFLRRLREARFDLLLTPLLDYPQPRLAKNAHKYYHVAVAGALGIFSRVSPYDRLPEGLTCLKAENTAADWYRVLREAVEMPAERFDLVRQRTLAHVREEFTETAQIHLHEAAWRATEFHAKTRAARGTTGRPRVVYALGVLDGEEEVRLCRWVRLVRQYGVDPVVVLRSGLGGTAAGRRLMEALTGDGIAWELAAFGAVDERLRAVGSDGEAARRKVGELLTRLAPALVHTIGLLPVFGEVCRNMELAHVASLYAVPDEAAWQTAPGTGTHCAVNHSDSLRSATQWRDWLGSEKFCARETVALESFDLGMRRHLEELGTDATPRRVGERVVVAGPLREAAGQLEAIAAVVALVRAGQKGSEMACALEVSGDTTRDPAYVRRCRERIEADRLDEHVHINDSPREMRDIVASADIVLSPRRWGGIPLVIKEAMAVGVLVVATPVGGVPEIVIDGVSGILCADASVEAIAEGLTRALALPANARRKIVEQARRVARSEFHPQRGASDLLDMYNRAIDLTRGSPAIAAAPAVPSAVAERIEQPAQLPASHVRLHGSLAYRLVPRGPDWHGVDVLVDTHQRPARGRLELTVLSAAGNVVRTATADLATARDNEWLPFQFAPIAHATDCPFVLRFSLADPGPRTKLSLYDRAPNASGLAPRTLRRLGLFPPRTSLYCRLRYA
jgi:glycosyltransferase involved in cell wall biosynthesis